MGGGGSPTLNFELFWFGDDDGTDETDNTFLGAKNSNQTLLVDTNYRFRVSVSNTGTKLANGLQLQLEYNLGGAGWNPVNATSSVVRMSASTKLTEGNDCTERLAGAQTFDGTNAGQEDNDGLTGSNNLGNGDEQEADYCFQVRSADVVHGNTIVLRVTDAGTPLDNDNQTPTITVQFPAQTVNLNNAALTLAGQTLTVDAPITINLNTAALTLAGQVLTPSAPVTVNLNSLAMTLAGQVLDVQPGLATVSLNAAALTLNGQVLDVQPGLATVNLNTASLTLSGQVITLVSNVKIDLATAALTLTGQQLDVQPGLATINLGTATLTLAGQQITVDATVTVNLNSLAMTLAGQQLDVQPGLATISLNTANLTLVGQVITIDAAGAISLNVLSLTLSGQQLDVQPGLATVNLNAGALTLAGQQLDVQPGLREIALSNLAMTLAGQQLDVQPGLATVDLATAALTLSGQQLSVIVASDQTINLATLLITMSELGIAIDPGTAPAVGQAQGPSGKPRRGNWQPVSIRDKRTFLRSIMPELREEEENEIIDIIDILDSLE